KEFRLIFPIAESIEKPVFRLFLARETGCTQAIEENAIHKRVASLLIACK
ncbi:MAG: hypothetical protein ACI9Y1_002880, partial [Lentisphaeria bacterium]